MRKLASIVEIDNCLPLANSDRLSLTTMKNKGWKVVTGRDEYKPGEVAVYFEIDSALPFDDARYDFLKNRCSRKFVSKSGTLLKEVIRIKTIKLRGEISQGLLMPISLFPELDGMSLDSDVTEILKVEHYDEIKAALAPKTGCASIPCDAKLSDFPTDYIPKTDEERIQNLSEYFTTMKGRTFEITEKRDGFSVTMFYSKAIDSEHPFGVCSRNMRLKPITDKGEVPLPWQMAEKLDAENKIKAANLNGNAEFAFQGELQGAGINSNRDILPDFQWDVFKVYDITNKKYLLPSVARFICNAVGFNYVPLIEEECPVFDRFATVDEILPFAEGKTARGNEREGLVFKSTNYPYRSFKAVSNRYLLKQKD